MTEPTADDPDAITDVEEADRLAAAEAERLEGKMPAGGYGDRSPDEDDGA